MVLAASSIVCVLAQAKGTVCPADPGLQAAASTANGLGALGNWFAQHGREDCAAQAFTQGLHLDPNSAPLHYSLALALYARGERAQASLQLQRSLALDPASDRAYLTLGVLAHDRGERAEALHDWEQAARLNPDSSVALDWIAKTRLEAGENTAAIDLLRTAPVSEDLSVDLVIAYSRAARFEEAIKAGGTALATHADWMRLRLAVATVLTQRNRYQEAVALLQPMVGSQNDSLDLEMLYLRILVLMNDNAAAATQAQVLLKRSPGNFDGLYVSGLLAREDGDYATALKLLQAAAEQQPRHYDVRLNLGMTLLKLHRIPEARAELEIAAKLPEATPEVHFQLAGVLRASGDAAAADAESKLYQAKLAQRAKHDEIVSLSSQASQKLAAADAAGAAMIERHILEITPDDPIHWYDLGLALDATHDYAGEAGALQQAVRLRPEMAPAWNALGYLEAQAGHDAEAEVDLRRAIAAAPGFGEAENNLGSLLVKQGKDADAEPYFRSAIEANPRSTDAWMNLAVTLADRSRFPEARKAAESALRVEPENAEASRLLQMLPQGNHP